MAASKPPLPRARLLACAAVPAATAAGAPVERVQLLKLGRNEMRDGRGAMVVADAAHAQKIVEATRRYSGSADIPIDYDHQLVFAAVPGVGGTAPAAGWITPSDLVVEADGIWAAVRWTEEARAKLAAGEYRYLSPVVERDERTHRVLRLLCAGLTNSPAIPDLAAVASTQEDSMDMTAIAVALGLPETATVEEIVAAIAAMKETAITPASVAEQVTAAVAPVKAQLETAAAQVTDLTRQLTELRGKRAEVVVASAVAAGKITPAQRDWWLERAAADLAGTEAYLETAPVILPPGETVPGSARPGASDEPTAVQVEVARKLGIDPQKMKEA
jgi:phage I-like protein